MGRRGVRGPMRPPQPLGQVLRQLARWAIASSFGAAAGCGDAYDNWTPISCAEIDGPLNGASFARSVDYFAFWEDHRTEPVTGERSVEVYERMATGTPCKSATDLTACMSMFEAASSVREQCRSDGRCGQFAVVSEGNRAARIDERAELLSWLAPIENLSDALTLSTWDQKYLRCAGHGESGTRYSRRGDGFVFGSKWDNCKQEQIEIWEVTGNGDTTNTITEKLGETGCAVGRRPEGLCPVERRFAAHTLAAHFAGIAHLEAASVYAFERLARELTRFGAPASLVARAANSALEEIHHAELMGAVAKRLGADPYLVRLSNLPARGLYQLALENAVEGCIHETFGALIAHHQAARAQDPQLRSAMRLIARDETRHAELAWQVAAWVTPQLKAAQRTQLAQAQALALLSLEQAQHQQVLPPAAAQSIGLPSPAVALALVGQLKRLVPCHSSFDGSLAGSSAPWRPSAS